MLVLYGDVPLITAEAITALAHAHEESGAAATMVTMELEDPTRLRPRRARRRRQRRARGGDQAPGDATPEQLAIREVNTGIYAFAGGDLLEALDALTPDNAQGEYYLPDVLPLLRAAGSRSPPTWSPTPTLTLGVNDRVDLATVRRARAGAHPPRATCSTG